MNAKQTAFLAAHAAALPAAVTAPDCLCLECDQPFTTGPHDVQICPGCYPLARRLTIQRLEEEARSAMAREACKLEDSADWDRSSGPRFYLSAAEKFERAAKLYRESGYPTRAEHCELRAQFARDNAPAPRPMAERAGLGDAIRRGMAPKAAARSEALEMARSCLAAYPPADLERQKGGAAWRQTATDLRDALAGLVASMEEGAGQ